MFVGCILDSVDGSCDGFTSTRDPFVGEYEGVQVDGRHAGLSEGEQDGVANEAAVLGETLTALGRTFVGSLDNVGVG